MSCNRAWPVIVPILPTHLFLFSYFFFLLEERNQNPNWGCLCKGRFFCIKRKIKWLLVWERECRKWRRYRTNTWERFCMYYWSYKIIKKTSVVRHIIIYFSFWLLSVSWILKNATWPKIACKLAITPHKCWYICLGYVLMLT